MQLDSSAADNGWGKVFVRFSGSAFNIFYENLPRKVPFQNLLKQKLCHNVIGKAKTLIRQP